MVKKSNVVVNLLVTSSMLFGIVLGWLGSLTLRTDTRVRGAVATGVVQLSVVITVSAVFGARHGLGCALGLMIGIGAYRLTMQSLRR